MAEIRKEVPSGRRNVEMILVRMLKKHMSWQDVRDITDALWRVGYIADSLEREHHHLSDENLCSVAKEQA